MRHSTYLFVAPCPAAAAARTSFAPRDVSRGRAGVSAWRVSVSVSSGRRRLNMLAGKARKQDNQQTSGLSPSDEAKEKTSALDDILPSAPAPPILPTLDTLTGVVGAKNEASQQQGGNSNDDDNDEEFDPSKPLDIPDDLDAVMKEDAVLAQMGAGLSGPQENAVLLFLKGVLSELSAIEWTPFDRVVRLTILVFIIIVVATTALYVVDGFLSRVAKLVFEDGINSL